MTNSGPSDSETPNVECRKWPELPKLSGTMSQWFDQANEEKSYRQLIAAHMKRCPVCHNLVCKEASECHMCSWRGAFELEPLALEESFDHLISRVPQLAEYMPALTTRRAKKFDLKRSWCRLKRALKLDRFDTRI